jgi:FdhD protein
MSRKYERRRVLRIRGDRVEARPDNLAGEEPLEIRVNGEPLAVTMRTPGNDFELAMGFLVSEGVVRSATDVVAARYCDGGRPDLTYNVVNVSLADDITLPDLARNFYVSSSCGVCGKDSLDAVRTAAAWTVSTDPVRVSASVLLELPDRLRSGQAVFRRTGGLHAAGLFDDTGELVCLREDVGRHNAVDKVLGWALATGRIPLAGHILQVSGRTSFELVQKAWMAGIPVLSAVSAPSSLAVDLAAEAGMTLAGFVRGDGMNVYTRTDRVDLPVSLAGSPAEESHRLSDGHH